jgi:colanic acid/amylovoran biosynthesis glycosyltransferase
MRDPLLVIIPSVPAATNGKKYILDEKAVSGLHLYMKFWPGPVRCIFREGNSSSVLFGREHDAELPFEVKVIPAQASVPDPHISDASVVLASGDNWQDFSIASQGLRLGIPVCFVIENILRTRLQITNLSQISLLRKMKSYVWNISMERKRRVAFARASGLQCNGTPAAEVYDGLTSSLVTFFDTRLSQQQIATDTELSSKEKRIMEGAPLRLAFTGRLEKMKGADDLIKIARALDRAGIEFYLDIFGTGSLESDMCAALRTERPSVNKKVRIHKPIDFDRELIPFMRSEIDLFLCCHRQSDPSCTYLETLGCGVPIVGYSNRAWSGILKQADVGWSTPINARNEFAKKIVDLNRDRAELVRKMWSARNFANLHSAEAEFETRVAHLLRVAKTKNQ